MRKLKSSSSSSNVVATLAVAAAGLYTIAFAATPACDRREGSEAQDPGAKDPTNLVSDAGTFTRGQLIAQMGQCALEEYRRGSQKVTLLMEAVRRHETEQSPASLAAARAAFAVAMVEYQKMELMQFGPFASNVSPGGEGVRDLVYSWPTTNRCSVDETLVARGYEGADFLVKGPINARGLAAVDYLLFNETTANSCRDESVINAQAQWSAIDATDLGRRRTTYARVIAEDVSTRLAALVQKWEPAGGNFLGEISNAGSGSRVYLSQQLALNSIMDGLFYIDLEGKDSKLGRPLGVFGACTSKTNDCADEVESLYSKLGKAHFASNLIGFRAIFFGCGPNGSGLGFDDLLEGLGAARLSGAMQSAIAEVETRLLAIPDGKLEDEIRAKSPAATALHEAVRKMGTLLKTEVVTVLNLELPASVEGDND